MARMVKCVKLGKELPGLETMPVAGELGKRIFENVSAQAWEMWKEHRVILINHYGLTLFNPEHQAFIREQLEDFFFGDDAAMPDGWTPPDQGPAPGKGGPAPAKGGPAKGGPAPQRK